MSLMSLIKVGLMKNSLVFTLLSVKICLNVQSMTSEIPSDLNDNK